ncbi:MAG: hypothetical protein FIA94_14930 [Nitrospirae bacterium]|nr:hypothetical protein [Nitrospirota bacterium]
MTNVRRQTVNGYPGDAIQYEDHFLILKDAMNTVCASCKYGYDRKPGGEKPSPGTVWCGKRKLQMAKHRQMDCFTPLPGIKVRHCADCKRAKITLPSGGALQPGNVWCDRKKTEIHKMRSMDCFE